MTTLYNTMELVSTTFCLVYFNSYIKIVLKVLVLLDLLPNVTLDWCFFLFEKDERKFFVRRLNKIQSKGFYNTTGNSILHVNIH